MDLAPYIRELILLNECVILPGFGGFETQYAAAKYDKLNKRMLPPTKKVHFRDDYVKGGGILEDHLCKHFDIESEQAAEYIKDYILEFKKRIDNNREAIISGVGLFTKGLGNSLSFTPFEEENYLVDSFGLEALPIERKEIEESAKEKIEFRIRSRSNTLIFVIVGVFVISVLLALTVFISSRFDLYLFNIGDQEAQSDLIIIGNDSASDSTYQTIDITLEESTNLKSALHYSESLGDNPDHEIQIYYLVAGSFKAHKNAEITRNELVKDGFVPEIIENKGYFRVAIGTYSDKQEALRELQRFRRQLDRSVWLLSAN